MPSSYAASSFAASLSVFASIFALAACAADGDDTATDSPDAASVTTKGHDASMPYGPVTKTDAAAGPSPNGSDAGVSGFDSGPAPDSGEPPFDFDGGLGLPMTSNDCVTSGAKGLVYFLEAVASSTATPCPPDCASGQCCFEDFGVCVKQ